MNETVRDYLIEAARKRQPVAYNQINLQCRLGLNLEHISDRNKLSTVLGEIAAFE